MEEENQRQYRHALFLLSLILWLGPWSLCGALVIATIVYGPSTAVPLLKQYLRYVATDISEFYQLWQRMEQNKAKEKTKSANSLQSMASSLRSLWSKINTGGSNTGVSG
jgi:predicted PurR-regulated permease PerM